MLPLIKIKKPNSKAVVVHSAPLLACIYDVPTRERVHARPMSLHAQSAGFVIAPNPSDARLRINDDLIVAVR